ncbi:MAG: hypothetical protein ICV84_00525 [Flavisolibacter sp.]|nr:hypothetical protein [Flavisolibacter sp.]
MRLFDLTNRLNCLLNAIYFLKKHYAVILTLGLIAAFGRVMQLGGFGKIASWMNIVLEVVVESARILLFLYVLGLASIKNGVLRIRRLFTHRDNRKQQLSAAMQKLKKQWFPILLNIIGFLLIAAVINYLIDLLAYETCLYLTLKEDGILADSSSEWTILLFFKNLSVIPFTLVFEAVFLLWMTNKFQSQTHSKL